MLSLLRRAVLIALPVVALATTIPATASAAPETGNAPVYLNHTYGIFSEATLKALQTNAYLKDTFGTVETRTTTRPDLTYTGTYVYGRETYLEAFPDGTFGLGTDFMGMALGDEQAGGIESVQDRWAKEFGTDGVSRIELISRTVNGVDVPWFKTVNPKWAETSPTTFVWNMEYVPDAGKDRPRNRREGLATKYDPTKLVENVQAVAYGLSDSDRANYRRTLAAVGWRIVNTGEGFTAFTPLDNGTSRVVYVTPARPGRQGLLGLVWKLNRTPAKHVEQLGDAVLEVGVHRLPFATLWFVPPTAADQAAVVPAR